MDNSNKSKFDKRQITIWSLIIIFTILAVIFIFWFVLKDAGNQLDKNLPGDSNVVNPENNLTGKDMPIRIFRLQGNYSGTRESIDGSIEAVFLQITDLDTNEKIFNYTLNIGTTKKFKGIGRIYPEQSMFKSDMIGDINYLTDSKNTIILKSSTPGANSKFKLVQEKE